MFAIQNSKNIAVRNTIFHYNTTKEPASEAEGVRFANCSFE